ncbi:MAG: rod shape-determining protein MreD [Eudoraea sp.]|nr:rod shape-determining protein MreD [Eudoraea sp.]
MNRNNIYIGIRFILLILAQVLIFNDLNFYGFINPMVYIMFLFWYPIKENRVVFLLLSFLLGLVIDIFSDTAAIHAAATVSIAYLRAPMMRFVFGINYEFQSFRLEQTSMVQQLTFLTLLILVHHTIFFTLEIFSFAHSGLILKKLMLTGLGTLVLCFLLRALFSREKQ